MTKERPTIAVRLPQWLGHSSSIWHGLRESATVEGGWRFVVNRDKTLGELPSEVVDHRWRGDGVITFRMTQEEGDAWHAAGIPVVNLSSEGPSPHAPRILPDNERVGWLAAQHLLDLKLEHVAFLGRITSQHTDAVMAPGLRRVYSEERQRGFEEACKRRGCSPRAHLLPGRDLSQSLAWKEIRQEVADFLASLPRPCGIFAADDLLALVAIYAAESLGARVPQDFPIVGFGNDPEYCLTSTPALSSVVYPGEEVGRKAAGLIAKLISGQDASLDSTRVVVSRVMSRESSAYYPAGDPEFAQVMDYIRRQAPGRPLKVSELADLVPYGMTALKRRFHQKVGHGPKQQIDQVRAGRLKELLLGTELSLNEIADSMGFGSTQDLCRFFAREVGESPAAFRDQRSS